MDRERSRFPQLAFRVLAMGHFGRASGVLGALSGSPSAGFWEVLERFRGSPGLLAGPRGNPRASWEPWMGPMGVLGDYEVVLGTSCRLLEELLRVLWGALGAVGRALGRFLVVTGLLWTASRAISKWFQNKWFLYYFQISKRF